MLPSLLNTPGLQQAFEEAKVMMPASYFLDDGTFPTRNAAFANFTFSVLLLLDQDRGTPPQSLIDCIAHGTVPMIVGKHHKLDYTRYFSYAVAKFRDFSVEQAITFMLTAPSDALYVYANSVKIVQEFFYMRQGMWGQSSFCSGRMCTNKWPHSMPSFEICAVEQDPFPFA